MQKYKGLVVTTKEIGLSVNAEMTWYMCLYLKQNAGQNHNIKIRSKSKLQSQAMPATIQFRIFCFPPKNIRIKILINLSIIWVWNLISHIEHRI